jgi:hypothetical protein
VKNAAENAFERQIADALLFFSHHRCGHDVDGRTRPWVHGEYIHTKTPVDTMTGLGELLPLLLTDRR